MMLYLNISAEAHILKRFLGYSFNRTSPNEIHKTLTKFLREINQQTLPTWTERDGDSTMQRDYWIPNILLARSRLRKLLSCKDILHFIKSKDESEDGTKSSEGKTQNHKEPFPSLRSIKEPPIFVPPIYPLDACPTTIT
jgi:hypothetical protein